LPADTTGFTDGVRYNRRFRVSGLPTLTCGLDTDACTQPSILLWNDATDRGNEEELMQAFNQNGLKEFAQFDTYGTQGPSSNVGNGLGSAGRHGANPSQLAGYSCLIYDNAALSWSLSNGSNTTGQDKGDDVGLLTAWFAQPAGRFAAYFGDDVVAGLRGSGITFSASVMGVSYVRSDARSAIGNQTAPRVAATAAGTVLGFGQSYVAYGGCLGINVFDEIGPGVAGAVKSHEFLTTAGAGGVYPPSASVYYARQDTIAAQVYSRANVTFPYGFAFVYDVSSGAGNSGGRTARANLLRELLINAGHSGVLDQFVVATDPIAGRRLTVAQNRPNPFNPVTEIAFSTPARGAVAVKVYNLRGELVTTLLNGVVEAGPQAVTWNGTDARGTSVASGIYVYRVEGFGQVETRKMALIK
jgi:hypothetical protein